MLESGAFTIYKIAFAHFSTFVRLAFLMAFTQLVTRNVVPDTSDISLCIPSMFVDYESGELIQAAVSTRAITSATRGHNQHVSGSCGSRS